MLHKSLHHSSIDYHFETLGDGRLPDAVEFALYRMCQELVNNVLKHARATELLVQLLQTHRKAVLTVEDNGIGLPTPATGQQGSGLPNLQVRTRMLGGSISMEPASPHGLITKIQLPL